MRPAHKPPSPVLVRGAMVAGLMLVVGALFVQSYNGRQAVVDASRRACQAASQRTAVIANVLRFDQQGNAAIARDPGVSAGARGIRARQAQQEDLTLRFLDQYIDRDAVRLLNPVGQRIVRALPHPYDCDQVFPDTPLFSFTR